MEILTSPEYIFLRRVFLLSAIASIPFGIIGTFVVVRRISYLAGAISHCAFGGIGFGLWLSKVILAGSFGMAFLIPDAGVRQMLSRYIDPVIMAILVAVAASLLVGFIRLKAGEREDTLIGILWSLGMAIGLLFIDKIPGYTTSVTSYLFGDVLLISKSDVMMTGILATCIFILCLFCFKPLKAICFDEEYARLRNIFVPFYFQLLLALVAITVVLMLRVVGMVLVIALLTIPAATAGHLTKRLLPMMLLAILFCFLGSWIGIYLSYWFNLPTGPVIIVTIVLIYLLVLLFFHKR